MLLYVSSLSLVSLKICNPREIRFQLLFSQSNNNIVYLNTACSLYSAPYMLVINLILLRLSFTKSSAMPSLSVDAGWPLTVADN